MPNYRPRHVVAFTQPVEPSYELPLAGITADTPDAEVIQRAAEQARLLEQLQERDGEEIAAFATDWDQWPVSYQPEVNRSEKQERQRAERVSAGKAKIASHKEKEKDKQHRSWWQHARSIAVARLALGLQHARHLSLVSAETTTAYHDADRVRLPAGELGWSDVGPCGGNVQNLITNLRAVAHTVTPQRQVNERWKHYVGSYPPIWTESILTDSHQREQMRMQCINDAQAILAGLGHEGGSVLFIHWPDSQANARKQITKQHNQVHWHLLVDRVQPDGMVHQVGNAGIALRVMADALDAEAGLKSGYDAPGKHDKVTAKGWGEAESGTLSAELRGGEQTVEPIPLLDITAAIRIAQTTGKCEQRFAGLMVLQKPSYKDITGIVRHCAFG